MKRIVALFLTVCMLLALMPTIMAAEQEATFANEVPSSFGPNSDYYEYLFGQSYVPGGQAGGSIDRQTNRVTSYELVDLTKTAPWKFANASTLAAYHMDTGITVLNQIYEKNLNSSANLVFAIYVPEAGNYTFSLMGYGYPSGGACDVYFSKCPDDFTAGSLTYAIPSETGAIKAADKIGEDVSFWSSSAGKLPYKALGTVNVEEAGTYLVAFAGYSKPAENTSASSDYNVLNNCLSGIKLTPYVPDVIESISLSIPKTSLYVGLDNFNKTSLIAKADWTVSGEKTLTAGEITFSVTPSEGVVELSADGVVTAVGEGSVTITATLKADETKTDSVTITVAPAPVQSTKEYIFGLSSFNKSNMVTGADFTTTPVLRAIGTGWLYFKPAMSWKYDVPADYAKDGKAFKAMDTAKTAPWELVDYKQSVGAASLNDDVFALEFSPNNYGTSSPSYTAFRLSVDAPGEYVLQVNAAKQADAPIPAVYFFRDGTNGVTATSPSTYPTDAKLSYLDIPNKGSGYVSTGKVNVTVPGDYIVAFVGDATSIQMNSSTASNGTQNFRLQGIKLIPSNLDAPTNELKLYGKKQLIMAGEELQLELARVYTVSGEVSVVDFSEYEFASSNENVATVDEKGIVTGVGSGHATITATKKNASEVKGTFNLSVYGQNVSNLGVKIKYTTSSTMMKDQTTYDPHNNRLDASGNLRDLSYVDVYDEIDETKTNLWAYSNSAELAWRVLQSAHLALATTPNGYQYKPFFALKFRVLQEGEYYLNVHTSSMIYGSQADFHVLPAGKLASVNISHATADNYVGTADATGDADQRLGLVNISAPGDYYLIIKFHSDNENLDDEGRHMFYLKGFSLVAPAGPFTKVGMYINGEDAEGIELPFGASREFTYAICDAAGVAHEDVDYENDVTINRLEITKGKGELADIVEKNGKYYIETYDKSGEVNITANMTYEGETAETVLKFFVADIAKKGRTLYTDEMIANARENIKKYSWAREQRDKAVQNADKFVALGAEYIWNMISGNGLPRAYNVALEISHPVRDPYEFYCRYCNTDLLEAGYGNYPWVVDGIRNPWKITCPKCSRSFPSNDFGKFYELGRTKENGGLFDRDTALEAHRTMLIEKGLLSEEAKAMTDPGEEYGEDWFKYYGYGVKGGYLHNDLYPEVGKASSGVKFATEDGLRNGDIAAYKTIVPETAERWGVDDGHGYVTGRVYTNGVKEFHTYIAYFNHFGVYYGDLVQNALQNLGLAYLYTGEEKYGRLGAIIIDRIADIYPDMSIKYWSSAYGRRYPNSTGGSPSGKDVGRIWGCFTAKTYADSYDIFYPMFEDKEVIEFLSNKASYYGMENDKSTPMKIRQNIEDGVCREIFEACKTSQINGNFGLHHAALIDAAVALDNRNDTSEMIEWLYAASVTDGHSSNTGGDVNRKLLETVYRDGMVNESPYYNDMTFSQLVSPASTLETYIANGGELDCNTLFEHPKFLKTFTSFMPITMLRRGIRTLADAGDPLDFPQYPGAGSLIAAFNATKNRQDSDIQEETVKIAQFLYMYKGEELKKEHYNIWTKNPETVYDEVKAVIDEHGEYDWDKSTIMTGYGYATLRDGTLYDTVGITGVRDIERDFMLNFSGHNLHNHTDMLDLQIDSYGIPLTYDFGYAEFMVTGDPHSSQLTAATIGHNTVVVDEKSQTGSLVKNGSGVPQKPLHFDAMDTRVKVMDARTPTAYENLDDYRRTIVMVDYDDEVSYGVDFFRVDGGSDHLWTFSPSANTRPEHSSNLTFVKQVDEPQDTWRYDHKNYYPTSSYAGPTVQFGEDPGGYGNLKYPHGYTWMYDVERCDNPGTGEFWLDYEIKDFRNQSRNPNLDLRLRLTMLNDFDVDEVSLTSLIPQRIKANEMIDHFEKVLVRRKGNDIDSLFTTVYEPYAGERYVTNIEQISIVRSGGAAENVTDVAKAVKVTVGDNRVDYIVYATNKDVIYTITDGDYSFEFAGFVGVWTVNAEGENTYSYIHDGSILGEGEKKITDAEATVTGKVVDFQKEFSLDNWIDIEFNREMSDEEVQNLVDRMILPEREGDGTSAYLIEGITKTGANTARINLNSTSTVDGYVDMFDESKGYVYVLSGNESFEIPMSYEDNGAPVFDAVEDKRVSVGSSITVTVNAVPVSEDLTVSYSARTLPRGAMFDAQSGTFSWKPSTTQLGKNLVAINAVDSMGRISTIYFEVEVYGSVSGGGGGGGDTSSTDKPDEPTVEPDEPTVEPDEPAVEPDEPGTDEPTEGGDVAVADGFVDLGNHAWATDAINYLADEGIIKGTSETTFSPASNITRADYAILLVRAFKLESENAENFADVNESDYFAEELAVARNTGIVGGIGDNKYAPRNTITRQDMMVILYRALTKMGIELKPIEGIEVDAFADYADVADYAKEAVKALVEAGLVNGKGESLAGSDFTTRAEVAVLLKRVLDYIK